MTRKFNILVVDDDLKNIQVGINFLKQNENYHLVFATSGQQALDRVNDTDFDLILLDIIMPVMDGYEVCRQLKANSKTKLIPIIFLTAKHEADSLMKGFELGGADYITKPFNAPELNARVKTQLELHYYYKTEIAKLQELLICSQKAETIKFIAGGITHDCNNFMTAIPATVHTMKKKLKNEEQNTTDFTPYFDTITTSVDKVSELLTELSSFSLRDESSKEIVDMNEVIYVLNKVYKGSVMHNIDFNIDFLSQPALVIANKLHVEQVLLNMLINAQHAILSHNTDQKGNIGLTIRNAESCECEEQVETPFLCIEIKDNGIGMDTETMYQIFDPYYTTRKDNGGTGLGLAVSQNIIQSHGGCIKVESTPNVGTTFRVFLPQYKVETFSK